MMSRQATERKRECCARCLALLDANLVEASHFLPSGRYMFSVGFETGVLLEDGGGRRMIRRCAPHPAGRAAHVVSRCSTRTLSKLLTFSHQEDVCSVLGLKQVCYWKMVVGEGFEPSKSVTADLQSAPFGRSGIPPDKTVQKCSSAFS